MGGAAIFAVHSPASRDPITGHICTKIKQRSETDASNPEANVSDSFRPVGNNRCMDRKQAFLFRRATGGRDFFAPPLNQIHRPLKSACTRIMQSSHCRRHGSMRSLVSDLPWTLRSRGQTRFGPSEQSFVSAATSIPLTPVCLGPPAQIPPRWLPAARCGGRAIWSIPG